jgi:hypothetical protein
MPRRLGLRDEDRTWLSKSKSGDPTGLGQEAPIRAGDMVSTTDKPVGGASLRPAAGTRTKTTGVIYSDLRRMCLEAVKQWPGCETIAGIQIIRGANQKFSVRVTLYGKSEKRIADRAIRCVEREMSRHFHLLE